MTIPIHLIRVSALFACTLCILLTACKKKEIAGPKGEPGTPGAGGNANIKSTTVFPVNATQWAPDTTLKCMKATLNFSEITKDVVSTGAVKVYIQTKELSWTELPYVRGDLFTQFAFDEGHLYLQYINIEGLLTAPPQSDLYRMVIYSETH
jgi:hypothetical protein